MLHFQLCFYWSNRVTNTFSSCYFSSGWTSPLPGPPTLCPSAVVLASRTSRVSNCLAGFWSRFAHTGREWMSLSTFPRVLYWGGTLSFPALVSTFCLLFWFELSVSLLQPKNRESLKDLSGDIKKLTECLYDNMTECLYQRPITSFAVEMKPQPVFEVDILAEGRTALERANHDLGECVTLSKPPPPSISSPQSNLRPSFSPCVPLFASAVLPLCCAA